MANIILFTDRTPLTQELQGTSYQLERYSRPAGAYKVASVLRAHGYSVVVVPNCLQMTFAGIKEFIDANAKDLIWVGISTTFLTVRSNAIEQYRETWRNSSSLLLDLGVLNNHHYIQTNIPTQLAWGTEEIRLISSYIDSAYQAKLILGGTWVSHIKNGSIDIDRANALVITGQNEDFIVSATGALKNKLPIPVQSIVDTGEANFKSSCMSYVDSDYIDPNEWLTLEVSRGCAFKCAYCTYDHKGKDDTTKHTKTLRDELIRNYEQWGVTKYHLLDDLYNDSDYKIKKLYDEVWSKLPFKPEWISYLRLDLIWSNPESAKWIEASGCKLGAFGIETLHDEAGKRVGKGLGKARILETLEHLKETWGNRVLVNALMIAGLPHEPYDHIVETMDWLHTTDLVHSYKYSALWVTPPEHKHFVLKQNTMSENYEKYNLTWGPEGWVNNMGVSFNAVCDLVIRDGTDYFNNYFPVDLIEYPELRFLGYTHDQLADRAFNKQIISDVVENKYDVNGLVAARLKRILSTRD